MNNWQIKKLGEVCKDIFAGGDVPKLHFSKEKTDNYNIPIFANGEKNNGFYGYTNLPRVTEPAITVSARGTIGYTVLRTQPFYPIVRLIVLIPNDSTDVKYLKYSIENLNIKHTGSSIPQLTVPTIKKLEIPIPPLATQQAIVSKIEELFSDLDQGIAALKKAQEQLKTYRQSVLKWAFEGKLLSIKNEELKIKNQKEGELPEGWEWKTLGDITNKATKVRRKEMNSKEEFIYLDIGGINNENNKIDSYKTYKWDEAPSRAQQIVKFGDVLFSTVRTYMKNIAIVDKEIFNNQIASSGFTILRANDKMNYKYIYYYSISDVFLNPLNKLQTGSSYPAVRDSDVLSQKIPLPPLPEQHLIVQAIESRLSVADKLAESINESLQKAESLRQSILKQAFEGKLKI